jgi:nucleoside-diphosphate-sugar epimerase
MSKTVLVTGGTGFVGTHCIVELLKRGYAVRTTIRRMEKKSDVMTTLQSVGLDPGERLSFFETDLLSDEGWSNAMSGCDYVLHVASPFPSSYPKDENEVIRPAKEGTRRQRGKDSSPSLMAFFQFKRFHNF